MAFKRFPNWSTGLVNGLKQNRNLETFVFTLIIGISLSLAVNHFNTYKRL